MKLLFLLGYFFITSIILSQNIVVYTKDPIPGFAEKKISKVQMKEDIEFWHKVMEESHVNLYHAISKDSLQQLESNILSKITDSITHQEAILIIGKLAASLNEGHVGLPSSNITDSLYIHSLRFPYLLQTTEDSAWVVDRDLSTEQKLGMHARIREVNNYPVNELNKKFREYYGGLEAWRKQQITTYCRKLLFMHGIQSPYTVKAITEEGQLVQFTVAGFTKHQGDSINKTLTLGKAQKEPYVFEMLRNNIAYINYRSMINLESNAFTRFLVNSFSTIKESRATGLIIDLRENGGGNSAWGDLLISYFSTTAYRFAGGMKWKISQHYKEYLKSGQTIFNAENLRFYNSMKNGEMYTYVNTKLNKPIKDSLSFKGKVAVLVGPNTFSSANMLADGMKTYGLATLFGEPTGDSPNNFGEMYNFMLSHTHVIARAPTKMFTRADGEEKNFNPVIPDIFVTATPQDMKQKKDIVLETAVNWLLKK